MRKIIHAAGVLAVLLLVGLATVTAQEAEAEANGKEAAKEDPADKDAAEEESTTAEDILTIEFIKELCGIEDELEVEPSTHEEETYTSCSYRWKAEAKRTIKIGGEEREVDDQNRISLALSIVEEGKGKEVWDDSVKHYKLSPDTYDDIEDVGDEAIWIKSLHQLCVRKDDHVLFVVTYYPDGEDDSLDYAKKAAGKILKELEE